MERLIEGYRRFRAEVWPEQRSRYESLAATGQRPETLVVACSDSRVDPQTVFHAGPGELFVLRNVAGLVPTYQPDTNLHGTSAVLEYGVRVLRVARIVVLGHAQCGGVKAMVEGAPIEATDFLDTWMQIARPALRAVPAGLPETEKLERCEEEVVRLSLANLGTFPWIREAVAAGRLELHGFRFGVRTGVLAALQGDRFVPVV
jgi:carbonic anhydrase